MTVDVLGPLVGELVLAALLGALITVRPRPSREDWEFVRAAALLALSGALMLRIVDGEMARAFGLMGAASVVRYRYGLRGSDDASALILSLGLGMACGAGLPGLAVIGAVLVRCVELSFWAIERSLPSGLEVRHEFELQLELRERGQLGAVARVLAGLALEARLVETRTKEGKEGTTFEQVWQLRTVTVLDHGALVDSFDPLGPRQVRLRERTLDAD
jgi:hypothetical protein